MTEKSIIYTRTGDNGTTSLVDGTRVDKTSPRLEAYGTVDELNSFIGAVIAADPLEPADRSALTDIQNRLFDIGGYLAAGSDEMAERLLPDLAPALAALEAEIDRLDASLPRNNRFILPQGPAATAAAHVARAVARRAERRILALALTGVDIHPSVRAYINRLSDYLFVLARHASRLAGIPETYWSPA